MNLTPRPQSVTERKQLAQEIKNELHEYKRYANATTPYTIQLARVAIKFNRLIDIENGVSKEWTQ